MSVAAIQADGQKRYVLKGKLFFASALRFHTLFDIDNDPPEVAPAGRGTALHGTARCVVACGEARR